MIAKQACSESLGKKQGFITTGDTTLLDAGAAAALAPLEDFMRRLCLLIDGHPEWHHQSPPERMENFLQAVQQL
jgi:hypothetical protein